MVIDGTDVSTCILSYELPDDEHMTLTYVRNPSVTHVNFLYMDCLYETNQGDDLPQAVISLLNLMTQAARSI